MTRKASQVQTILNALKGTAYMTPEPLQDYHAAKRVRDAMRIRNPQQRLSTVREALNRYRVSAWLEDDGVTIRLVLQGQTLLQLGWGGAPRKTETAPRAGA